MERYLISKHINTSYEDIGKITPLERKYLYEWVTKEIQQAKESMERLKNNTQ